MPIVKLYNSNTLDGLVLLHLFMKCIYLCRPTVIVQYFTEIVKVYVLSVNP